MKVRIAGTSGLCDAALVRTGSSNDVTCRIQHPNGEEVFCERRAFRQRCVVAWRTDEEWHMLQEHGFID